ncbi:MAG: NhaP-type Na+/H+ or K+/H+ antiporter/mannitol [Myxococcota bacterium]
MEHATLTLVIALAAGTLLIMLADRLRMPSIVLLMVGGVLLGPEVIGLVHPESLGHGLETVIGLAVAVILFEGGLTLDVRGYARAPVTIRRMLSVGVVITWLGMALAVWGILDWPVSMSLLAGSLVIVTGPTVISPLLRRMRVRERIHHALYWEGVLIDAVGVFVAVLCFEYFSAPDAVYQPIVSFVLRVLLGVSMGALLGFFIGTMLARHWVEEEHANIFALAMVLLGFGVSNAILEESGLLTVVTAGLVVAVTKPRLLSKMKTFKLELTELAIGLLFILLSAKLELDRFLDLGVDLILVILVVLFVLRPINIFVSTLGQGFARNEKLFLSWVAPRGIVAASMASLFSLRLQAQGVENAVHLETITYAVIGTTVALQGLSAPWVARLLNVAEPERRTWLLLGERALVQALARALKRVGVRALNLAQGTPESTQESSLIAVDTLDEVADDPRLADVDWVLSAHWDPSARYEAARTWSTRVGRAHSLVWGGEATEENLGTNVFKHVRMPGETTMALEAGDLTIQSLELSAEAPEVGRFGRDLQPLFVVSGGVAKPVTEIEGPFVGEHLIALKRVIHGLSGLIVDVERLDHPDPTMRSVILQLMQVVAGDFPTLPVDEILSGIMEREASMSSALGGGLAIPHAYYDGVQRPRCYLAVIGDGMALDTPDSHPVSLVALLISPPDQPKEHLRALSALVDVLSDEPFKELLLRQRTPERIARLIEERS